VSDSSVTLKWTRPKNGAGVYAYEVLQGRTVVQTLPGDVTTTAVTGIDAESLYTFTVVASDSNGRRSKPSNAVKAATVASGLDDSATPANLHACRVSDHSVSLDWDQPANATNVVAYDVYAQGQWVASVKGTSVTVGGLDASENIQFVVKSRDSAGRNSPPSRVATVTTSRHGEKQPGSNDDTKRTVTSDGQRSALTSGWLPRRRQPV